MKSAFVCPRCGNCDPKYLGHKNGEIYCRRCIEFQGEVAEYTPLKQRNIVLDLGYSLSKEQQALSDRVLNNFIEGKDTLVYAVCGSGKTEISYGVMAYAMGKGLRVGFALPRRDVVIELHARLKQAFPDQNVVAVYGGNTERIEGDCLVLTTHQLYRYPAYFDLLVLDEIDAFPFKGDVVLQSFFQKSLRGHYLMMSATPSKEVVRSFQGPGKEMLSLHTRFHKHPIPVPRAEWVLKEGQVLFIARKLWKYRKEKKPCFVFVPRVEMSRSLYERLRVLVPNGNYVSSKREGRERIISDFKRGRTSYLVTTAVLERGITVANLQVIVAEADNAIYDAAALVQIAGRAGRKASAPSGEVIFLYEHMSQGIKEAIHEIEYCNTYLPAVLQ